jgi:hypothetical protein
MHFNRCLILVLISNESIWTEANYTNQFHKKNQFKLHLAIFINETSHKTLLMQLELMFKSMIKSFILSLEN